MRMITASQLVRIGFDQRFSYLAIKILADINYQSFFELLEEGAIANFGDNTFYITRKGWEMIEEAYGVEGV